MLLTPCKDYTAAYASTLRKYWLCLKAADAHSDGHVSEKRNRSQGFDSLVEQLISEGEHDLEASDVNGDAGFVTEQLKTWVKVRVGCWVH